MGYLLVKDVTERFSLGLKSRKFDNTQKENDNWERPRRVYYILSYLECVVALAMICSYMVVYYNAS